MTSTRPATLRDVAARAGVSVSTASRALSGRPNVDPELARLVREAADALGYRPNVAARSLRMSRTLTVGAVFNHIDSILTSNLIRGLEAGLRVHEYALLLTNASTDPDAYRSLMDRLSERQVDALIVYRPPADLDPPLQKFQLAQTPVLALFAKPRGLRLPLVTNRPNETISRAVDELARLGHQSIGYVATQSETGDFRSAILEESARRNGMDYRLLLVPEPEIQPIPISTAGVIETMSRLPDRPTAVFARDRYVPGLIIGSRARGWRVAKELSIVSFGDSLWAAAYDPPIDAIHSDGVAIGLAAAETAISMIAGEIVENRLEVGETVWDRRGSIGPAPRDGGGSRWRRLLP